MNIPPRFEDTNPEEAQILADLCTIRSKRIGKQKPLFIDQEPITIEQSTGRNDPCPCGSGKKFKRCCK